MRNFVQFEILSVRDLVLFGILSIRDFVRSGFCLSGFCTGSIINIPMRMQLIICHKKELLSSLSSTKLVLMRTVTSVTIANWFVPVL